MMLDHVIKTLPEEACGLMVGRDSKVITVVPVTNQLHSTTRYFMDPVELVKCFHWLDDQDMEILAIYHSHPKGPDHLSETDIKEFNYPGVLEVIWFPKSDFWEARAFLILDDVMEEIPIIWSKDS